MTTTFDKNRKCLFTDIKTQMLVTSFKFRREHTSESATMCGHSGTQVIQAWLSDGGEDFNAAFLQAVISCLQMYLGNIQLTTCRDISI